MSEYGAYCGNPGDVVLLAHGDDLWEVIDQAVRCLPPGEELQVGPRIEPVPSDYLDDDTLDEWRDSEGAPTAEAVRDILDDAHGEAVESGMAWIRRAAGDPQIEPTATNDEIRAWADVWIALGPSSYYCGDDALPVALVDTGQGEQWMSGWDVGASPCPVLAWIDWRGDRWVWARGASFTGEAERLPDAMRAARDDAERAWQNALPW